MDEAVRVLDAACRSLEGVSDAGAPLHANLQEIWERFKPEIEARVEAIESAAIALLQGDLGDDVRRRAREEAHKLAGVAGTFGFMDATDRAREAEGLLAAGHTITSPDIMRLSAIAVALRHGLLDTGRPAEALPVAAAPVFVPIRVGMIDDDPSMLALVAALLAEHGIAVEGMSEPERLWAMLEDAPPDLLILDVDMPMISGIDLCKRIRANARWDALPIVFLTARTGIAVDLFGAGADNYLTKPVNASELLAVVERGVRRQRSMADVPSTATLDEPVDAPVARRADVDVVIVDDDSVLSDLLAHSLDARGHSTRVIADGSTALATLTGAAPLVHARVIILDVGLPEHDGLTVLRALARDGVMRDTRVIMLTARSLESEVMQALDLGAYDHVAKPFSVPVLMHRIGRALADTQMAE